jgi:threonylcarbamoyladenosine tRNA methylthiotransferase MtaB
MVERLPFTSLHVFPYSPRPGTAATRLGGAVPGDVSRRRASELRSLAEAKAASYSSLREGGSCDVVITERGKGLTEDYLSVSISDRSIPRRSRFRAVLRNRGGELTAIPA